MSPGAVLSARGGGWGSFAYLAVSDGIDVPPVMGSRSTHTRSGLGGLEGRMLAKGDGLHASGTTFGGDDATIEAPWLSRDEAPIRVVLGPQDDYFDDATIALFQDEPFTLTPVADRMAYKMTGPRITHVADFNIVSDGVSLGAIQVAGDGQPLVQMADRAPTGGYPKIAHVCRADIGRLAQLRPGESCRFKAVDGDAARAALMALEDQVATTRTFCVPLYRVPTSESLFAVNLIDGVVDALAV